MAAIKRQGKPYIWVTWISGLLGGKECEWAAWFKAHYKYDKYEEEEAGNLVEWNRQHDRMMRERKAELEEAGWEVHTEGDNEFKLEGASATVAGKPDLVAHLFDKTNVIDGKTGRPRDSDWWQVLIYLWAWVLAKKENKGVLLGEVRYKQGDRVVHLTHKDVEENKAAILRIIGIVAADTPAKKVPSRDECKRCNIGPIDCPERVGAKGVARTTAF